MKRILKAIAIVLCLSMVTPEVAPNVGMVTAEAATKIKLNCTKKTIGKGSSFKLKITGTCKKVKWSSSDKKVATVSSKGVVKGVGAGTAKIVANVGGKKYTCNVTVKIKYGTVNGNVTYLYNMYRGGIANPGSPVILIPKDNSLKKIDKKLLKGLNNISVDTFSSAIKKLKKIGVYATITDDSGNFTISNVPTGDYLVYIISHETTTGGWYDAYDTSILDVPDSYYKTIASKISACADSKLALLLGKAAHSQAFVYKDITVHSNKKSTVTYVFPCTYI